MHHDNNQTGQVDRGLNNKTGFGMPLNDASPKTIPIPDDANSSSDKSAERELADMLPVDGQEVKRKLRKAGKIPAVGAGRFLSTATSR
jgi:hypothetical protein